MRESEVGRRSSGSSCVSLQSLTKRNARLYPHAAVLLRIQKVKREDAWEARRLPQCDGLQCKTPSFHAHTLRLRCRTQKRAERRSTSVPPIAMPMPADGRGRPNLSSLSLSSGPLTDTCSFRLPLPMAHAVAARRRRRAGGRPTFTQEEEGKMAHLLICLARHLTSLDDSFPPSRHHGESVINDNRVSIKSLQVDIIRSDCTRQEGSENQNTGPLV